MARPASLRLVAALLLLLATIVFVIGITAERSIAGETFEARPAETVANAGNAPSEETSEEGSAGHDEGEEAEEANEAEGVQAAAESAGEEAETRVDEATEPQGEEDEASETILGINPESTGAVAAAVLISLLLAAGLWLWKTLVVLVAAAVFALLFAALDLREVAHQIGEARSGLAAVALLAAALHLGAAVVVGLALTRRDSSVGSSSVA